MNEQRPRPIEPVEQQTELEPESSHHIHLATIAKSLVECPRTWQFLLSLCVPNKQPDANKSRGRNIAYPI